ncbi:MAG: AAA family ATPase [Faecousia sp.]
MKIKLAILERDRSYLSRIVSVFGTKYSEKFEIYSFSDLDVAWSTLAAAKIDVLLAGDTFEIDVSKLPNRCAFAYLVDSVGIEMVANQRAICKFQKADLIYKQILSIYAEKASSITGFKVSGDNCKVIAFCSASGGVGSSTMAAACSVYLAARDKKVLYLNLEKFGSADTFFSGQGQFDMSDIIFALKSKKTNLPLKLESCVRQDQRGVYFYSQAKIALDMMEMNDDDVLRLLSELKATGNYQYIILDTDFGIDKDMLRIYRQAQEIIWVGDGSFESNTKIERAYTALTTLEQNADAPLMNRLSFIYNKVSSKTGHSVNVPGLKSLGGAPRYARAEVQQVIEQIAAMDIFEEVM